MKTRTLILLVVLVAIATFTMLNWNAFMVPTTLSLGLTAVQAPLGLVMLGFLVFLTAVFLIFAVYIQASALFEARRHEKELQTNRELADKAEASRFTELRAFLDVELKKQVELQAESRSVIIKGMDNLKGDLLTALKAESNSLAAFIGELEGQLEGGTNLEKP